MRRWRSGPNSLFLGLNSHWAGLAATTAQLLPAVACSVNLPSGSFLRPRTGAPDPLRPAAGAISAARKLSFVLSAVGESAARQVLKFGVLRSQRKRNTL